MTPHKCTPQGPEKGPADTDALAEEAREEEEGGEDEGIVAETTSEDKLDSVFDPDEPGVGPPAGLPPPA